MTVPKPIMQFFGTVSIESITLALILFFFTIIISDIIYFLLRRFFDNRINKNVSKIISRTINYLIYGIGIYLILSKVLGLNLSSVWTAAGIATIIVGLSAHQLFQNIIAGIIITIERPIRLGDWVEVGGFPPGGLCRVRDISLLRVVLRRMDGSIFYAPTSNLLVTNIFNYTRGEFIRASFNLEVPVDTDIKKIERIILGVCRKHPDVLPNIPRQKRNLLENILEREKIPKIEYMISHFKKLLDSGKDLSTFSPKVIIKSISNSKIQLEVWIRIIEINRKDEIISEINKGIISEFKKNKIKLD